MQRSSLMNYLAARLIEDARNEQRDTREIRRRASSRKEFEPMSLSDTEFQKRYRLNKEAFKFLCGELRLKTFLESSKRITLEMKVLCALSFYATGSYQRLVGVAKHLGQTTVSKIINEVTEALVSPPLINSYIKFPVTRAQRDLIKNKFYVNYGIPGVIGCVDGCHFHIFTPPKENEHLFYCRKHFHSLNVQMICDSDCRILNVNAKYGGASHDAFVWDNSQANYFMQGLHRQQNEHVWLLGDSGYPQRPWLMTPIPDASEGSPEAKYTSVHGKARVTIENTFGRLKNRWRCLCKDRTLHYSPKKCANIIMACCVLHNISIDFDLPSPEYTEESTLDTDITDIFVDNGTANGGHDLVRGRAIRSMLVERINRLHA